MGEGVSTNLEGKMATLVIKYKITATSFDVFYGEAKKIGDQFDRIIFKGTGSIEELIKNGTWSLFKAMLTKEFKITTLESLKFEYSDT
jgi:hypothetical protein